jgi:hypothetical protein
MGIQRKDVFSDQEMQTLILAYVYSRSTDADGKFNPVEVAADDIKDFLDACLNAVVVGQAIRLAAKGLIHIVWDKGTGKFGFAAKARK